MSADELIISKRVRVPLSEVEVKAVRAQGPGGQNVNKSSTAVELRFDIRKSSLPEFYQRRLLARPDRRISRDGVVVIKAQTQRSRERNRESALERLRVLIRDAGRVQKKRIPTKPGRRAKERRLEEKARRSRVKSLRGNVDI